MPNLSLQIRNHVEDLSLKAYGLLNKTVTLQHPNQSQESLFYLGTNQPNYLQQRFEDVP